MMSKLGRKFNNISHLTNRYLKSISLKVNVWKLGNRNTGPKLNNILDVKIISNKSLMPSSLPYSVEPTAIV